MLLRVVIAGVMCGSTAGHAESVHLTDQSLRALLAQGGTIRVDAPLGHVLPVKYAPNGTMSGEAGNLAYFLGAPKDQGKWWVSKDRLCLKWSVWFEAKLQCISITQDGTKLRWKRDDGETGTATMIPPEIITEVPSALGMSDKVATSPAPGRPVAMAPEPAAQEPIKPVQYTEQPEAAVPPPQTQAAKPAPVRASPPVVVKNPAVSPPPAQAAASIKPASPPVRVAAALSQPPVVAPAPTAAQPLPGPPVPHPMPLGVSFQVVRVTRVADNDVLNVRQGPSPEAPLAGTIPPHSQGLRITGRCVVQWCPVSHHGVNGWVNSYYLATNVRRAAWAGR